MTLEPLNQNTMLDKILIISSSLLLLLLLQPSSSETFPINIWPVPTTMSWPSLKATNLSSSFQIISPYSHKHLRAAVKRYSRRLFSERYRPIIYPNINPCTTVQLSSLTLTITDDADAPLRHGVDESYTLSISSACENASLTSETVWGAIRGLESFSQLAWGSPPMIACDVRVYDKPKFAYRGVLLDTARNYYPVKDILRTVRAMGENKLNVFHWHITDSQSFPIELPSEPELAKKGAYGDHMKYSPEDVKRIVEYATSFGVRVMPEIDTPGHTGSWAGAYPDIVTCDDRFWLPNGIGDWANRYASEPGTGHLNPLHPKTYQVLHNVLRDVTSLFPDSFYHAGADEVIPGCWKADPAIQSFLSADNNATINQVLELFIRKTHPLIVSMNRTAVYYEDVLLDQNVHVSPAALSPSTTILQTWNNGPDNTKLLVGAGYRTIVSSSDFYYLDCGHGAFPGNDSAYDVANDNGTNGESGCGPFKTWQRIYDYDITYGLTEEEAELVLGGEVALWSEQADPTVLDGRIWPRASALAESMWSGNRDESGRKRSPTATDRLMDWRYRMVGRGIMAEPIQPLWCRTNPGMCNLNE